MPPQDQNNPPSNPTPVTTNPVVVTPTPLTPVTPLAPQIQPSTPNSPISPPSSSGQIIPGGFNPAASTLPPQPVAEPQPFVGSFDPLPTQPGQPVASTVDPVVSSGPGRRFMKPLLISIVGLLIVGGASAAAYFGVIVPNKPANVLKTALLNSIQEKQISSSGHLEADSGAIKATFSSAVDTSAKAADLKFNLTYSGVSFPIEGRLVQGNAYFKVGDLSTISSILGAFSPEAGSVAQNLSQQVSNKWVVVDSTIINEDPTVKCLFALNWTFTKSDISLLQTQYGKHPFTTIQSTSSDTIDGQAAEKFVLNISDDGVTKFGNNLQSLSIVKDLNLKTPT